jgi:hypothetical protein
VCKGGASSVRWSVISVVPDKDVGGEGRDFCLWLV